MLTKERLDEVLLYDKATGHFHHKGNRRTKAGTVVGWNDKDGYLRIQIGSKSYAAHRLAFLTVTGSMPTQVDHINRRVDDNRWENLRPADASTNACNRASKIKPKSGHRGVHWVNGAWNVRVKKNGRIHYGGRFRDVLEAAKAAAKLRLKLHGEYAYS